MPRAWRDLLDGYRWDAQTIGQSNADVFRIEAAGRPTLFVKSEPLGPFSELPSEAARLRWLSAQGVAAPQIVATTADHGRDWLLMSALPGRDLASTLDLAPAAIVALAADALRDLHRLDVGACPFDHRLEQRIAEAGARVAAGEVDETDFDAARDGRTAADLFDELRARRPATEDLVVTHGDACLPNLMAAAGRFTGFIDCARLGVADRHQDLALAAWSIEHNLGQAWVTPFLDRYGVSPDEERLDYFRLLDEFF